MNNKKGFTLIEILAVIIIMGIIMIVAVPAVTKYINDSRKSAYITTAKDYIKEAESKVVSKEFEFYDKDVTYYINIKNLPLESGGDSPFGEWVEAYVVVAYTPPETYHYYWVSLDSAGFKVDLTAREDLDESDIYSVDLNDANASEVNSREPIGTRNNIVTIQDDGGQIETTQYIITTGEDADKCYSYEVNQETNTAIINYYDISCGTDLMIPSRIDGYEVTEIFQYAFYNMGVTSVIIPSTVKTIGHRAFASNKTLKSVTLPEGLVTISSEVFQNDGLPKVNFPSTLTSIGARSFKNNLITKLNIPPTLKSIGSCAFCGNPIPSASFLYKKNDDGTDDYSIITGYLGDLTEFTDKKFIIPEEVNGVKLKVIAGSAFYRVGLTGWTVVIPSTVQEIGSSAFYDNNIAAVEFKKDPVTNKSSLKKIGASAFLNNRLVKIDIPESVNYIGTRAFTSNYATETKYMWIYNRVTTEDANGNAIGVDDANGNGIVDYSSLNSYAGKNTSNVVIPEYAHDEAHTPLRTIGGSCFFGEKRLTGTMTIPSSVTKIGTRAFANNTLTHIDNGDGRTDNGNIVYQRKVDANGNAAIDYSTIISYGGSGGSVVIKDTVKNSKNEDVAITTIASNAFYRTYITSVTIGANVTSIGSEAFSLCRLTEVTIPKKVNSIGSNAFHKSVTWTSSNGGLTKIINKTKDNNNKTRAFAWEYITYGKNKNTKYDIGIVPNYYGDIEVVAG